MFRTYAILQDVNVKTNGQCLNFLIKTCFVIKLLVPFILQTTCIFPLSFILNVVCTGLHLFKYCTHKTVDEGVTVQELTGFVN